MADDIADLESQNDQSTTTLSLASLLKTVGAVTQGIGAERNDTEKAKVAEYNANVAGNNAALTGAENAANEQTLRMAQQQKIGQQRANLAEAGTGGLSSGSNAAVINQSEVNANMAALTERYKGNIQQTKLLNEQNLDNYYASVDKANASTDVSNTALSATSQLVSGFGRYLQGTF